MPYMIRKTAHGPRVLPVQDEELAQMQSDGRAVKVPHMSRMYREVDAPPIEDLPVTEEVIVETKEEALVEETKPVAENTYSTRSMQAEKPGARAVKPRQARPARNRQAAGKPTGDAA